MSDQIRDTNVTQQCENCLQMIDSNKISTHFAYCRRNIKKCEQCSNMYDINEWDEHEEEFHKKFKCQNCGVQVPDKDKNNHIQVCPMKPKRCQYCDLSVPLRTFEEHFKACESRTNPCEKCGRPIQNKQFYLHISICQGIDLQQDNHNAMSFLGQRQLLPLRAQNPGLWGIQPPQPRKRVKKNVTPQNISIATRLFEQNFSKKDKRPKYVEIISNNNEKKTGQTVINIDDENEDVNQREKKSDVSKIGKTKKIEKKEEVKSKIAETKKIEKKEEVEISSNEISNSRSLRKRQTRRKDEK